MPWSTLVFGVDLPRIRLRSINYRRHRNHSSQDSASPTDLKKYPFFPLTPSASSSAKRTNQDPLIIKWKAPSSIPTPLRNSIASSPKKKRVSLPICRSTYATTIEEVRASSCRWVCLSLLRDLPVDFCWPEEAHLLLPILLNCAASDKLQGDQLVKMPKSVWSNTGHEGITLQLS